MYDRQAFIAALTAALQRDISAAELEAVVSEHFPDLNVFRENDDLIIMGGEARRLLVRRVGPDHFLTSGHAAASGSTNLLDLGGESERHLDGLIDEIAGFAAR
jgi:hypothetical protein